uniref:clustered mitochondria protein homolog isoform X1 n=1 Tax=Ciona intestinalis TaxID=7719 RepID=UPI000EF4BAE2|nr:clustered mitochondria protein homolog isoform X1 [Ciona intestinalis]|eukprot:XP_026693476.1 clustered mitochondria protein homolog isoform X1 [Ciona intestinalis]
MTNAVKAPEEEGSTTEVVKPTEENSNSSENGIEINNISETITHSGVQRVKCNGDSARQESDDSAIHSDDDAAQIADENPDKSEEKVETEKKDQEVIITVQDNLFTIKINAPGVEVFEAQVSPQEMVQELHQLLMDREDTCHRTCFSLQYNGIPLDNFSELKSIEGLKEGSEIKVIEEPYSVREARLHVRHVRELLHSVDYVDAYNGADCSSLSYVNIVTDGDVTAVLQRPAFTELNSTSSGSTSGNSTPDSPTSSPTDPVAPKPTTNGEGSGKRKKQTRSLDQLISSVDCTPPDCIMPGYKECLLTPMHPVLKEPKLNVCLKVLTMSMWNPPPGNRKLHGDLLYLYAVTSEQKRFHITASSRGFYVNQSDMETFNPKPIQGAHVFHCLIDLLSNISPVFKRNFTALNKKRFGRHPYERIATPFQVQSWSAPALEHNVDLVRAEDSYSSRLLFEEHIPGQQTRDWNEELSSTRELPKTTLPERLLRERAMFKVHSDFVAAATRGAMMVIDGNVMAINPGDAKNMRMYIWNNIFFSLGFDVRDHYKNFGGNHAAFYAPCCDLNGVKAYGMLDTEGLYTLGTVVVDYRGFRVTAQSIIPGILEREQEHSVVYGSIDFGKTAQTHEKYVELLEKTTKQLHVFPHCIKSEEKGSVKLYSSLECKGIIGNDQRHYILDLLRTFPPDVNFLPLEGEDLPEECKKMGFPKKHRHRLSTLRPELVEVFIDHLYVVFMRHCASQIVNVRNKATAEQKPITDGDNVEGSVAKSEDTKPDAEQMAKWQQEAVRSAAKLVGSYSDTEFDIRFNPDIFSPDVEHDGPPEELEKQKELIKQAARFILTNQIPTFVKDCLEHTAMPTDGASLSDALHERGINVRYLGKIIKLIEKTRSLEHIHRIGLMEIVLRSTKHIMRNYLQNVDQCSVSSAVSHFLNCFLGSFLTPVPNLPEEELISNKKKKRARKQRAQSGVVSQGAAWHILTPEALWEQIETESSEYYDFKTKVKSIDELVEKHSVHKVALLRRFCITMGIQLLVKDYAFDSRHKSPFTEEDVTNLYPVIKHAPPRASDAYQFYTSAQSKVQQGYLKEGFELFSEALNLFNNVYGAVHGEIAACYRHIARLNYMMGEHADAITNQQKAVILSERVLGIDNVTTIMDYISLALYCFANRKISAALKLLYRARYLFLCVHGNDHPEISLVNSNIGLVLHGVQEYDLSLRFLEEALKINVKYHGQKSLKAALSHHLVARAYSCKGEFRSALNHEKETYKLYKSQLGEEHDKTKESGECLRHLTEQAVTLQRTMNEIYKNGSTASIPPLQITPPSMHSVLDLMNVINGIIFIPLSQKDLEAIRHEVHRQQVENNKLVALATKTTTSATTAMTVQNMKEVDCGLD